MKKKSKRKKGDAAYKIDLEKTYDNVDLGVFGIVS